MSQTLGEESSSLPLQYEAARAPRDKSLLLELLILAFPVFAEHVLHIIVGVTDTYLANHLPKDAEAATAVLGHYRARPGFSTVNGLQHADRVSDDLIAALSR